MATPPDNKIPTDYRPAQLRRKPAEVEDTVRDLIRVHFPPQSGEAMTGGSTFATLAPQQEEDSTVDRFAQLVERMPGYDLRGMCQEICQLPQYNKDAWPKPMELVELMIDWAHNHLEPPANAEPVLSQEPAP